MRRVAIAGSLILALSLALVLGWLSLPYPHSHPRLEELALQARKERESFGPEKNGFNTPNLQSLWSGGESLEPVGANRTVGTRAHVGPLPFRGTVSENDAVLGDLYDSLLELSGKAVFYSGEQPHPGVALQLVGRAILQEAASQPDLSKELEGFRAVFALAGSVRRARTLDNEISSLQLQSDAFEALAYRFPPSRSLTTEQWKEISTLVVESTPDPQRLLLAVGGSSAKIESKLNTVLNDPNYSQLRGWFSLPGWKAREQRFLNSLLSDGATEWERGVLPEAPPSVTGELAVGSFMTGERGLLTSTLCPPYWVAAGQTASVQARLTGLGLSYALLAYRAELGAFPQELSDLRHLNLTLPPRDELQALEVSYQNGAEGTVLTLNYPAGKYTLGEPELKTDWVQVVDGRLVFRLAP